MPWHYNALGIVLVLVLPKDILIVTLTTIKESTHTLDWWMYLLAPQNPNHWLLPEYRPHQAIMPTTLEQHLPSSCAIVSPLVVSQKGTIWHRWKSSDRMSDWRATRRKSSRMEWPTRDSVHWYGPSASLGWLLHPLGFPSSPSPVLDSFLRVVLATFHSPRWTC